MKHAHDRLLHLVDGRFNRVTGGSGKPVKEYPITMKGSCCSLTGPLTNLPVRQNLSAAIEQTLQRSFSAAVMVVKIGDLTEINHWQGYEIGDRVIRTVMGRIEASLEENDFVGRLGGGHFLVFLNHALGREAVAERVQSLLDAIAEPMQFGAGPLMVNASAGVSLMPEDAHNADDLLRNAELALRNARTGRVRLFSEALQADLAGYAEVRSALVGALEREEFFLVYQPQVCATSGRVFGVEALLRWQSPALGQVPPDRFIPVAENVGLMPRIGEWVLARACRQASQWRAEGKPLRVAVNISATQLEDPRFSDRVRSILAEQALPAEWLELEVTESMLVGDVAECQRALQAIRNAGVKLALDDFGTGYSNLAYLRHFTFDTLKIDRLFTNAITSDSSGDGLVRAIVAMGSELGQDIVAEGVETAEQAEALRKLGCSRMQGYYFSRPVPAGEISVMPGIGAAG